MVFIGNGHGQPGFRHLDVRDFRVNSLSMVDDRAPGIVRKMKPYICTVCGHEVRSETDPECARCNVMMVMKPQPPQE
jgi:DNA-directed RNA polymerase subunit RPC12/RpoP